MDKSSFSKLFKEMYVISPDKWNDLLTKAGKTVYSRGKNESKQSENQYSKANRQSIGQAAFKKLMNTNYDSFNKKVDKPKSIRVNDKTLSQFKNENPGNSNVETTAVDSSAIESFKYDPVKKNLDIKYTNGDKEYRYPNVPRNVANGLYAAPSKGSYVYNVVSQFSDISDPEVQKKMEEDTNR